MDSMTGPDEVPLAKEVLNNVEIADMPAHKIRFKIGPPVLLMRKLDAPCFVNDTLCVVRTLLDNVMEFTVLTGPAGGQSTYVPRIPVESSFDSGLGFSFRRLQFSVSVASE